MDETKVKEMLADTLELIVDLDEQSNDQFLQVSAMLAALGETVPGFAQAYVRTHNAEIAAQIRGDSEGTPSIHQARRRIQQLRKT